MKAKEFLLTDLKLDEAVSNGYDIRLTEEEVILKMEAYADYKVKEASRDQQPVTCKCGQNSLPYTAVKKYSRCSRCGFTI